MRLELPSSRSAQYVKKSAATLLKTVNLRKKRIIKEVKFSGFVSTATFLLGNEKRKENQTLYYYEKQLDVFKLSLKESEEKSENISIIL